MSNELINEIEAKLSTFIKRHQELKEAFQLSCKRESALLVEQKRLLEKNEIARARIEAMIPRMKQLEAAAE